MAAIESYFGKNAGTIWSVLSESGPQNISALKRKTKMSEAELYGALGWLAREGKLKIIGETPLLFKFALVK